MNADASRKPNPWLSRLGQVLEAAINRALALDPGTREQLSRLNGRRIGIEFRPLDVAMAIAVDGDRVRVGPHWQAERDLNLRASPASLLAFALRRGGDSPIAPGKVDISGDAELARHVEKILRDFRPDIEEAFAHTFGDVIGVPIARAVGSAFAWSSESAQSIAMNAADFLRDESRDVVAAAEAEQFFDEVDALRERSDRLQARINRVERITHGDKT